VYVRFGEPIALRRQLERHGDLPVERLAFAIANGINAVTPLTAVSALCSVFLGAGRRALTLGELEHETERLIDYAANRGIALAPELEQGAKPAVLAATSALRASGVVSIYDGGIEAVYSIHEEARHVASFYRNTTVHFFLSRAIATLARDAARRAGTLEGWALRLRDLLKFEFFFPERDAFLREIEREQALLTREPAAGRAPLLWACPRVLLDFLESYWVVAETLRTVRDGDDALSRGAVLRRCHELGRQLLLQDRVQSPELLSNMNFGNALRLLENLGAAMRDGERLRPGPPEKLDPLALDLERLIALARRA
jgi:glycerol-3-phosphate O-acyltransferase